MQIQQLKDLGGWLTGHRTWTGGYIWAVGPDATTAIYYTPSIGDRCDGEFYPVGEEIQKWYREHYSDGTPRH